MIIKPRIRHRLQAATGDCLSTALLECIAHIGIGYLRWLTAISPKEIARKTKKKELREDGKRISDEAGFLEEKGKKRSPLKKERKALGVIEEVYKDGKVDGGDEQRKLLSALKTLKESGKVKDQAVIKTLFSMIAENKAQAAQINSLRRQVSRSAQQNKNNKHRN